ncbi:MAG: winged helix-turn-helix domain-containing protein [Candidatus Acidiferrales bacterium]
MRKLEIGNAEVMQVAIRQEIARSEESRYDHRLHGLLLVAKGESCRAVAELFDEDARTVQRWVQRFEVQGFEGLREGERPGRPGTLDARQWQRVAGELRRSPREFGHAANLWDGKVLAEHLKKRHGVSLGVRQCQRLFRRMGFRLRKPRPEVAQADPVRVAAVKKTAPSRKTPRR